MQGGYVKVRYKPTNRVEFHNGKTEFGYDEEYVGDIIFSTNLSFVPVDLRYGPRGAMYVCDWYNPIKARAILCATNAAIARAVAFGESYPRAKLTTPPKLASAQ